MTIVSFMVLYYHMRMILNLNVLLVVIQLAFMGLL